MSKKLLIVIVLKSVRERKSEVGSEESTLVPFIGIRMIINISSNPMPPNTFIFLYFIWKTQDFHSVIIQRVWFRKIQKVEFNFLALGGIWAPEKVPLGITIRVYVILQDQVIFILWDFDGWEQVAGLKPGLENQGLVLRASGLVELLGRNLLLAHLARSHAFKISFLPVNIIVFNQFLNID